MQANPDEEFDYFLAEKLHMTVARLRAEMSNEEWEGWAIYHGRDMQRKQVR